MDGGLHLLNCSQGLGRYNAHAQMQSVLVRACRSLDISYVHEPSPYAPVAPPDNKALDLELFGTGALGSVTLGIDVSTINPLAPSHHPPMHARDQLGWAALKRTNEKDNKYVEAYLARPSS